MITVALTWFFNNLPVAALPLAVRPALYLLQRLVPYLGYLGTFIAWSWNTIKTYDVGGCNHFFQGLFGGGLTMPGTLFILYPTILHSLLSFPCYP